MNGNATYFGRPDVFQQQLDEYRKVTPADVQRVANNYLNGNRLVMTFVPAKGQTQRRRGEETPENTPTSTASKKAQEKKDYSANLPKAGRDPQFALPKIEKQKLSNGMEVWLVRQPELPIVSMNLVVKTGGAANPRGKEGLAGFTAGLMNQGTKTRSAVDISNQLQEMGTTLNTGSGWDSANVSMQTLTKNLDRSLELFSDVVLNPSFPAKELETSQARTLIGFRQGKDNPNAIASIAYNALLYGKNHPYGNSLGGDEN